MKKVLIICLALFAEAASAQLPSITVNAGGYNRKHTIIEAVLPKAIFKNRRYKIVNERTGAKGPIQCLDSSRILFILPDVLQAGEAATYKVVEAKKGIEKNEITVQKSSKGLLVKVHGKDMLFYNTALINPPDTLPPFYARSGFIHPLYSPSGNVLTDDFSVGHAHQHGIMTAWVNAEFKGKALDFWNQQQKTGSARHVAIESIESGAVATIIKLRLQQYSFIYGTILSEQWMLTVYPFDDRFVFDLRSVQQNITTDTLCIKKYHYGSIAFRGSQQWNDMDSLHYKTKWSLLTDSGATLSNADGKRAAYVSASGLLDGAMAGAAVFSFPTNYRYPQPIRVHPQMPYWGFAPAALAQFTINPGNMYSSRYRYFVYDGLPDTKRLNNINDDLVHPPAVTVTYKKSSQLTAHK